MIMRQDVGAVFELGNVTKVMVNDVGKVYYDYGIRPEPDGTFAVFRWGRGDLGPDRIWSDPMGVYSTLDIALSACDLLGDANALDTSR